MPTVLLLRHAQASFGGEDYDVLSTLGLRQARVAGEALDRGGARVTRVIAGTLRRQVDTATALGRGVPDEDPRWDEFDADELIARHGDGIAAALERSGPPLSSREFQDHLDTALTAWMAAGEASPCARTWDAFREETRSALDDAASGLGRGEVAVVVTSAGVIGALAATLLGCGDSAFLRLNRVQVNAAFSKVAIGARGATLISLNDHSHLESLDRSLVTYR